MAYQSGATGAMSSTRFCAGMLPFRLRPASNGQLRVNGGIVKTVKVLRNVVGSAGLLFMGYVVLTSLPDLRRYIRISPMGGGFWKTRAWDSSHIGHWVSRR